MMKETEEIVLMHLEFLPLKSYTKILLRETPYKINWEDTVPKYKLSYISGNPPFVGYFLLAEKEQKNDILSIYIDERASHTKTAGKIDYVSGWYFKAAQFAGNQYTQSAFVSTNSITQESRLQGYGSLYMTVLMYISILLTEHLYGTVSKFESSCTLCDCGFSKI